MDNNEKKLDLSLAERVFEARAAELAAKEAHEAAKKAKAQAERDLLDEMLLLEIPGFKYKGKTFFPRMTTHYSIVGGEENNGKLCDLLVKNGLETLIKTKVHAKMLGATIKEDLTDENGKIPDWLSGMVRKYETTELVLKK